MPYFARINTETNEVVEVIRCDSKEWCDGRLGGTWFRTYYDTEGKNYAGIGFTYHPAKDNFSAPKPYPSWTLDDTCTWQPPVSYPLGEKLYIWNEETQSWDETEA
jgi:hypothetical protein